MNVILRGIIKLKIFPILLLLIVSCETGGDETDTNPFHIRLNISADSTIVCFGDSLTFGDGTDAPPEESYPWWLQDMVNLPVINSGESGDTTTTALTRIQTDVFDYHPVIVLLELGANDYLTGVDPEKTGDNLHEIIESCLAQDAVVFLCRFFTDEMAAEYAQTDPEGVDSLITMFASLARKERVFLIEDIWGDIRDDAELMYDTAHPNGAGYHIMAQRIFDAMEEMLAYNGLIIP